MVDPVVAWVARIALAGVFASAALHKWREPGIFAAALAAHQLVPAPLVPALAPALAATETAIAARLLLPGTAPAAGWAAATLLGLYSFAVAINLARGRRDIDCGCSARPQPLSLGLLARNATLAAAVLPATAPVQGRELFWIDALSGAACLGALGFLWLASESLAFGRPASARLGRSA